MICEGGQFQDGLTIPSIMLLSQTISQISVHQFIVESTKFQSIDSSAIL